jgi:hypothetical protein
MRRWPTLLIFVSTAITTQNILFTFNSIKEKWKSVILHKQSFHKNSMDDTGVSMIVKESKYIEKVDFC